MRSIRTVLSAGMTTTVLVLALAAPVVSPASAATPAPTPSASPTPSPTPTTPAATTFRMPLAAKSYSVSAKYGPRCLAMPGSSTFHLAVDLAAKGGAAIYAIAAGVVTATVDGTDARDGYISVRHTVDGVEYTSRYVHIWKSTTYVKVGQKVAAGQRISSVGTSGTSTGNHLHLEVWRGSASLDPAPFLKGRGVDLYGSAAAITAQKPPASCTYYTTGTVNFRSGPSTSTAILRVLAKGTAMVHTPGQITAGFLPVRIGSVSGWISSSLVTPVKPAAAPASVSVKPVAAKPATYATKTALNLRAAPSTSAKKILTIAKGKSVGTVKATKGVWRKVTYAGKTGWVHSAYLKKR